MSAATELSRTGVILGNDLTTNQLHEIPAGGSGLIAVDVASAGEVFRYTDPETLILSTRSRYAQLGGEFPHYAYVPLGHALVGADNPVTVQLPFVNHSLAPIALEKGEVCKVMSKEGPPISGDYLMGLIEDGQISMGGKEGKDWWIAQHHGVPIGVALTVQQPETWIPPSDVPIRPTGPTTETFRAEMERHFQPIRQGDHAPIGISQTSGSLFTAPTLIALLEQNTEVTTTHGVHHPNRRQINSPALYGGYPASPWPIRTELLSTPAERMGRREPLAKKAVVATFYPVLNRKN